LYVYFVLVPVGMPRSLFINDKVHRLHFKLQLFGCVVNCTGPSGREAPAFVRQGGGRMEAEGGGSPGRVGKISARVASTRCWSLQAACSARRNAWDHRVCAPREQESHRSAASLCKKNFMHVFIQSV